MVLVAQDTTSYGNDLKNGESLTRLLRKMSSIDGLWKIRILYAYPERMSDELISEISQNPKIAKYLDLPLQHADPVVLKRMGRKGTGEDYLKLIRKLRNEIPDLTLRSTFIAGFPGETEEQFSSLLEFLNDAQLDRAGCFSYSQEEGPAAGRMKNQIDEEIKENRRGRFYELQETVSLLRQDSCIGREMEVICDGYSEEANAFVCRGDADTPEDDYCVLLPLSADLMPGEIYSVIITGIEDHNLLAEIHSS